MSPNLEAPRAAPQARRLYHLNLGFARDRPLTRILALAGHELRLARPGLRAELARHAPPKDAVAVWGASPTAWRGETLAQKLGLPLLRLEDAFLRSLKPGRAGAGPMGLLLDMDGVHFDPSRPSRLERILRHDPLDDGHLLSRAKTAMARLRASELSKYNLHWRAPPRPGYVLVIDQVKDDASVIASGANQATFDAMLARAREEFPRAQIWIKRHPETTLGLRQGHFAPRHLDESTGFLEDDILPYALLEGAIAVYTVSSQLGFEAILAGHKPKVWGLPFYAGWGLSEDEHACPRRNRPLTPAQLFTGAMLLAPLWYDPIRDRLCALETVIDQLEAEAQAYREDRAGYTAYGMRAWKRPHLQAFFGGSGPIRFRRFGETPPARPAIPPTCSQPRPLIWGAEAPDCVAAVRVEDGFLRSNGLGADLVPPLSLLRDEQGLYYDPSRPSSLEIALCRPLPAGGRARAETLLSQLRASGVSKYNTGHLAPLVVPPEAEGRTRVLVIGQVEDDASIQLGTDRVRTNLGLLEAARAQWPEAWLIYKPHPDCEAGLRKGHIAPRDARTFADQILEHQALTPLFAQVDRLATMTSLAGFEALIHGCAVTTFGAPFYAGWGLTTDLGTVPLRRLRTEDGGLRPRVDLVHLTHAALIAAPRYFDPRTGRVTTPEATIERLVHTAAPNRVPRLRPLARLQRRLAAFADLWR